MSDGPAIKPSKPARAPGSPRNLMPIATDRLITLPPGRNWHRPSRSVKSEALSQRRRSTIARRASGSAPPNEVSPRPRKPLKNFADGGWRRETGFGRVEILFHIVVSHLFHLAQVNADSPPGKTIFRAASL